MIEELRISDLWLLVQRKDKGFQKGFEYLPAGSMMI